MKKLLFFLLLISTTIHSQTRYPFGSKHKNIKTITLSNGKYDEFFDEDTLQRVGSSVININTKKITKIKLSPKDIEELENKQASRFLSVDPLTKSYPWYSPYQFAGNTPIQAIDLDGLEEYVVTKELFRNGATKKIIIQYSVQKDDILKKVNSHFKELLKLNSDGSIELGTPLTDKKVIRIVIDGNGNESSKPDDNLTKQEEAIVNQKSENDDPTDPTKMFWTLTLGKKLYYSETQRNTEVIQDKVAEKKFTYRPPRFNNTPLVPQTTLSNFNGSNNYYYGGSFLANGGQLGNELISSLTTLANQLRVTNNVNSITVNLNQGIFANSGTQQFNTAQRYGQIAVANMVRLLQQRLTGTGIIVNTGITTTIPNSTAAGLRNSGNPVGANIQIN